MEIGLRTIFVTVSSPKPLQPNLGAWAKQRSPSTRPVVPTPQPPNAQTHNSQQPKLSRRAPYRGSLASLWSYSRRLRTTCSATLGTLQVPDETQRCPSPAPHTPARQRTSTQLQASKLRSRTQNAHQGARTHSLGIKPSLWRVSRQKTAARAHGMLWLTRELSHAGMRDAKAAPGTPSKDAARVSYSSNLARP